jgi:acyl-CoA reductase-like NAD-dependent aldehyde dehydrogenase
LVVEPVPETVEPEVRDPLEAAVDQFFHRAATVQDRRAAVRHLADVLEQRTSSRSATTDAITGRLRPGRVAGVGVLRVPAAARAMIRLKHRDTPGDDPGLPSPDDEIPF